jgi:hypothetical protein
MALLIVMERMSPVERLVYVLHDVFAFPFEKIATMVQHSPALTSRSASRPTIEWARTARTPYARMETPLLTRAGRTSL